MLGRTPGSIVAIRRQGGVLLSNGDEGHKEMEIGKQHAGKVFTDLLQKHPAEITIDENGWAGFHVQAGSVSVWVDKSAIGK